MEEVSPTARDNPLGALHEIALLIAAETELDNVLTRVIRSTEKLLGASSASVSFREPDLGRRFTTLDTNEPHWVARSAAVRVGGITDTVLRRGVSIAVEDVRADSNGAPRLQASSARAVLAAPLRCQGDVIGVLYANFGVPRRFSADEVHLLETLGAHAATAVRNARLLEAERLTADRQAALRDMMRSVNESLDVRQILQSISRHARAALGADEVSIHRLRPDGLLQGISIDPPPPLEERLREPWAPDPFVLGVLESLRARVKQRPADDPATHAYFREHLSGVELTIVAPLAIAPERLGVLAAVWRRPHEPDEAELELFEVVASHAALAIQNVRAREAEVMAARLDGAIKTAQAAAHELSQPLSLVVGYGELIEGSSDPEEIRRFGSLIAHGGRDVARKLEQFRKVMRFVELRFGDLDPILDVERSSAPEEESA